MKLQLLLRKCLVGLLVFAPLFASAQGESTSSAPNITQDEVYFNNTRFTLLCQFDNAAAEVQRYATKLIFDEEYASLDDAIANMKKLWKKGNGTSIDAGNIDINLTLEYNIEDEQGHGFACYHVSAKANGSANIMGLPKIEAAKTMKAQYFRLSKGVDRGFIFDTHKKQVMEMDDIFQPAVAQKLKTMFGADASLYAEDRCLQIVSKAGEGLFIFSPVSEKNFTDSFKQTVGWQQLASSTFNMPKFLRGQKGIENFLNKGNLLLADDNDSDCDTVVVSLIVNEDGSVMQPHVEQTPEKFDDTQLLALCGKMPKWMPAYENGKPVAHEATFTVRLKQKVYDAVERMPEFPGGQAALMQWISANLKYPKVAEENGVQGRVVCTYVVERNGDITDVKVVRGVDPSLDKEAVRLIRKMPRWVPGHQNGKPVRVKYTIPVTFRLK